MQNYIFTRTTNDCSSSSLSDASLVILMPGSKKDGKLRLKYFQMHTMGCINKCNKQMHF